MANTFGILSALVLAFSAFVAFKNKEEFTFQKDNTQAEQAKLDINNRSFNALVASIDKLTEEKIAANTSRDEFNVKLEAQAEKNKAVSAEIAMKEKELDSTKAEVAEAEEQLKELGNVEQLASKIKGLQDSVAELTDETTILKTQTDRLRGEEARTSEALTAAKKKLSDLTSGRSLPTMKTKIRSIDSNLGIVTLAAGIRSGVIGGSKVAVMRGGEKIGELNIKAVSANVATADVIQSSLKEGETVSVGDTVVPVEVEAK